MKKPTRMVPSARPNGTPSAARTAIVVESSSRAKAKRLISNSSPGMNIKPETANGVAAKPSVRTVPARRSLSPWGRLS